MPSTWRFISESAKKSPLDHAQFINSGPFGCVSVGIRIALLPIQMDTLSVAAVSGMKARLESLALLANNIANAASPGFKADSERYTLFTADLADTGQAPLIEQKWTDFSQGTPLATGNATDLALRGRGYFLVASPSGEQLLTRNGAFQVSGDGRLETQDGYAVLDASGSPVNGIDSRMPVEFSRSGAISQGGRNVGQLGLVQPDTEASLVKRGALHFALPEPGAGYTAAAPEVLSGRLESANFSAPVAAVRLIDVLRQFETLQKAIHLDSEMGQGMAEIARPGN